MMGIVHTSKNNMLEISYCHCNSSAQKPAFQLRKVIETGSQAWNLNIFKHTATLKRGRDIFFSSFQIHINNYKKYLLF